MGRCAMSRIIILLSVMLLSPTAAPEATDCPAGYREIARGFLTGQECLEQNEADLGLYVAGIVDGLHVSPFAGASKNCLRPLEQCLVGTTNTQLGAVLRKWLKANPDRWHVSCSVAAWVALREMCRLQ